MNLNQLINRLRQEDPNRQVPIGFCSPHSHRGDYSELAFDVELDTDVRGLLSAAEYAVDQDFEGYKGGSYRMTLETECYLTSDQSMSGIKIDTALLDQLLFVNPISDDCVIVHKDYISRLIERDEKHDNSTSTNNEQAGYVLAMRLLQSDLDLDDLEMGAIAQFTQPEVMRRVLRAMK